jgi:dTDP-4-amino-4,6-dideoxygalactose transaminase
VLTLLRMETNFATQVDGAGGLPLPASARSVCRLATGRSALFHLIARLPTPHACTVLMPCYIAEGVIRPFRAADFNVRFYRLNADLTPNEADVAAILDETPGRAVFMLIHYFGFSSASKALLDMLRDHRAIVASDCAHALLSTTEGGIRVYRCGAADQPALAESLLHPK